MYEMPRDGRKYELVNGELAISATGMRHEAVAVELVVAIGSYLKEKQSGNVYASGVGYKLPNGDVLSPDVSFVATAKLPQGEEPEGFGKFSPDLAIEIVTPSDSMYAIEDKVEIYLKYGTQLVWVINPYLRKVTIHRADGTIAVVRAEGTLDGESVLPGFFCKMQDILTPNKDH